MLTRVMRSRSAHTQEVVTTRGGIRTSMDLYINIEPQKTIYLLWEIFLDVRELFSGEVQLGDPLSESQF